MIIINKPNNELIECKCYKCGKVLYAHPAQNSNSPYLTDCKLHNKENSTNEQLV